MFISMAQLFACPFCRELYTSGEAEICPECDVVLRPLADLPPSLELVEQQLIEWEQTDPLDRKLPWTFLGRGRGAILVFSVVGLGLFFCPWIGLLRPHVQELSGFHLAQARGFWFGGGAIAWLVALALVGSRRTLNQMYGIRAILAVMVSVTFFQTLLLMLRPPNSDVIRIEYFWAWGIWASGALSLFAIPFAMRLGGDPKDIPEALKKRPSLKDLPIAPESEGTSDGHTIH